jgi:hypothetical protein
MTSPLLKTGKENFKSLGEISTAEGNGRSSSSEQASSWQMAGTGLQNEQ